MTHPQARIRAAIGAAFASALALTMFLAPAQAETRGNNAGLAGIVPGAYDLDGPQDAFAGMDALQIAALPAAKRIAWNAPNGCVPGELKAVLSEVVKRYGPVTVNSTTRSTKRNRAVGGKSKSFHLNCRAVDFRVHGSTKGLLAFLSKHRTVGGYKRYTSGFYHIDNGPRRSW